MFLQKHEPSMLRTVLQQTLDVLLPPRCIATGEIVDKQGMISPRFWSELVFIENPMCNVCGLPFPLPMAAGGLCAGCLDHAPRFDMARSCVAYNDASRKVILNFKYGDRLHSVHTFIPWLLRAGADMIAQSDLIVPVPLHRKRLWTRRFNQSALLAQELARQTGKLYAPDTLLRKKCTPPQKGLSRKERNNNVRNAFAVSPRRIAALKGRNVLLIDDVFTSGATLDACTRTLKEAGAVAVYILTIARVTRESD